MHRKKPRQHTIRNIPAAVDTALRARAKAEGKSLDEVMLEALARSAGLGEERVYRDLRNLAGTWQHDPVFDEAIACQDTIDPALWP